MGADAARSIADDHVGQQRNLGRLGRSATTASQLLTQFSLVATNSAQLRGAVGTSREAGDVDNRDEYS